MNNLKKQAKPLKLRVYKQMVPVKLFHKAMKVIIQETATKIQKIIIRRRKINNHRIKIKPIKRK